MKKGKVIVLALSHKNGKIILGPGDEVTENDVNNFDKLVKQGFIEVAGTEKAESDLMKLKKDELQEKCIELDIDYDEADTKAILVALIEEVE